MSTLAQLSRQLDNALRAFAVELAKSQDEDGYTLECAVRKRSYDGGPIISYECGEYGDRAKGNTAEAVLLEYRRRKGWNEAHKPMELLEAPTRVDDEIPF